MPNLFIVGAAKSGTSSLWYLLKQHPQIFMPEDEQWKEPAYFSELKVKKVGDFKEYLSLFAHATNEIYIGEASTAYLTDPTCARRLYQFNPNSKIIILLRNPIKRAYSLYNWMVQEGYEYSVTFEDALSRELERRNKKIPNFLEPEYYSNYLYYESGLYCDQVIRYTKTFNKDSVFIGLFEDFIANPKFFVKKILSFLNLPEVPNLVTEPQNPSQQVLHPYLSFVTRKFNKTLNKVLWKIPFLSMPITKSRRDLIFSLITLNRKPEPMQKKTYQMLQERYEPEYQRLERELNLNLTPWRQVDRRFLEV
jgi:hypothetical protein